MSRKQKIFSSSIIKFKENFILLFLITSLIAGVITGALFINAQHSAVSDKLTVKLQEYIASWNGAGFFESVISALKSTAPFYIISVLLSFTSISLPIELGLPFVYSLGYGTVIGYIYSTNHFSGIVYVLIMIALPFALSSLMLIFSMKESIRISTLQFKFLRNGWANSTFPDMNSEMKLAVFRQFFYFVFLVLSAFIKSINIVLFRDLIHI